MLVSVGAIIAITVNELLNKFEIDDVVGAVPVHLAAGIWGTLAVGFFSDLNILDTGLDRFSQIKSSIDRNSKPLDHLHLLSSFIILSLCQQILSIKG